ncbi:nucleotidyltransferase family protein [Conexibacter woesei]|nr:nucleotidyltransferase family protein [Conexibacter woesei]
MTESGSFLDRLPDEGRGVIADADARGLKVRLLGGIAIKLLLGDRFDPAFERPYGDIDVLCGRKDGRGLEELLAARGWEPAKEFNALNGARRLLFHDPRSSAQVDVFVGEFSMCHALPLADSLGRPGPTLPAIDLVMTKLQIVELNAKDRSDLYALLSGSDVGDGDHAAIEPRRMAELTSRDWGLHHTFELNLAKLRDDVAAGGGPAGAAVAIDALIEAMEAEPKSRGWKMRARVGERKRWYELPEEVDREG